MNPTIVLVGVNEYRQSLKRQLKDTHFKVSGELADANGIRLLPHLAPDVVIVDVSSPLLNAWNVLPRLAALPNAPTVIAIGATASPSEATLLRELGATDVVRPDALHTIVPLLRQIHRDPTPAPVAEATAPRWSWLWRGVDVQPELRGV